MSSTTADNDLKQKSQGVRYYLENDLVGCDAKWTLFVAAAFSYQYKSLLKPFPPRYIDATTGHKNIHALALDITNTPSLSVVQEYIIKEEYGKLKPAVINLLHFVLVELNESRLHSVDLADFEGVLLSMGQSDDVPRPTHVFKVGKEDTPREVVLGEQLPQSIKLAFHPNKLDNFFAMLMRNSSAGDDDNTAALLNRDLGTCCKINRYSAGWGGSCCGSMISCVALCDYDSGSEYSQEGNEVLVHKKSEVRIIYLLMYGKNDGKKGTPRRR